MKIKLGATHKAFVKFKNYLANINDYCFFHTKSLGFRRKRITLLLVQGYITLKKAVSGFDVLAFCLNTKY